MALAGCAAPGSPPADAGGRLFARSFEKIGELYLRPVSSRSLAVAGLDGIGRLDPDLRISETPGGDTRIVLLQAHREVATFVAPAPEDADGWGDLVEKAIDRFRQVSPRFAAFSDNDVEAAVFTGATGVLDRYSRYAGPVMARAQRAARDGFGGVGLTLGAEGDTVRVSAVLPGGPAATAGLLPGDAVVAVDGVAVAGRPEPAVAELLQGPVASEVAVAVRRGQPSQTREFRLTRALIVAPTVTEKKAGGIAVIRVSGFNENTVRQLAEDLQTDAALQGVVLDLRGNPGGLLDQAVGLANLFIAAGPVSATVGRNPASRQFFAADAKKAVAPEVPLVVLVNGGSASSSEIVAAALQDRGRAVVIGNATFGKGTVQTVLRLPNDGELTLTWAMLVTPSGYLLQGHGVVPTLCTDGLPDEPASLEAGLRRAAEPVAHPRAVLDDAAWKQLRAACPPRLAANPADLPLALHLLADPARYREALHALTPAPKVAAGG